MSGQKIIQLVPVEPTVEMICAGDEAALEVLNDHTFALREETLALKVYRAMLKACAIEGEE